jgi:hypothetical protein
MQMADPDCTDAKLRYTPELTGSHLLFYAPCSLTPLQLLRPKHKMLMVLEQRKERAQKAVAGCP